jgi:predicted PurR-regulated permease PerM
VNPNHPRVPKPLEVAAAVAWRLLVLAGLAWLLWRLGTMLYEVVLPVAVAGLLAALLTPMVRWLAVKGVPRTLASVVVLVGGLAVVGGVLTLVISTMIRGWPQLQTQILASADAMHRWLLRGPLGLSETQLNQFLSQLTNGLRASQAEVASSALSTAGALASFGAGLLLGLFTLIFLLRDGGTIWRFVVRVTSPTHLHRRVDAAGRRAFAALVAYVRATAAVASMDALFIGVGTAIVGVPMAAALAALVFLGAFVPYVGGVVTGSIAILVALATQGPVSGLVVLLIVIGVMQLEGHVLQPLLLGRAARLHPLAVVLSITAGFLISGVAGALLAVPLVAGLNAAVRSWNGEPNAPEAIDPYDPRHSRVGAATQSYLDLSHSGA